MRLNVTISRSIIVALIFILLIEVLFPNVIASPTTDSEEGVWYDTFDDLTDLNLINTALVNGAIECKKGATDYFPYNFSDQYNHYAYAYSTLIFFPILHPPTSSISQETLFDTKMNDSIKGLDNKYAPWNATWLKKVIQHFRFQLHSAADIIDNIDVLWYGKATDQAIINYYFWNSSKFTNGAWQFFGIKNGGNNLTFNKNITHGDIKYALDTNNYIDICVVASPKIFSLSRISLSTNYIKLLSKGEKGYKIGEGTAETIDPITPKDISPHFSKYYWEMLTWDDYQSDGATIRYQLLYENNTNKYVPVPNEYFLNNPEGKNSYGFTQPPIYLNAIPYEKLKIKATLNTTSPIITPRIFSWAITWQNSSQWHDSFNTSYRVDKQNKVVIANSIVNISKIQGEWPMFGFNSENNRATTISGPSTYNLNWYSNVYVGGGFRNPVIGNGKIYIVSYNNNLYQYNMKLPSGTSSGSAQTPTLYHIFDYNIVNSPAITEDYIIIATGQTGNGGHINHIYALPRENISKPPSWDFSNNNIPICYFSSPVVAGDKIFITSWGGDDGFYPLENNRYKNNKLLSIDLKNENRTWQKELSAPSFSTPAVSLSRNIVIAGCDSTDNESLFAFNLDGTTLWSKKIGAIGYASPVIYKNMVFVITTSQNLFSFKTNISALNLTNGAMLWNKTICSSILKFNNIGDSTPAIFNDILFVASPNGTLFAFHTSNGTQLWSTSLYIRPMTALTQSLISSPMYANGNVYIGTPSVDKAEIIALTAATGKIAWSGNTFYQPGVKDRCPILGSPIVSNGLLFVADENGNLYSIGTYKAPSQQIEGNITSIPIKLPELYWWNQFYAYSVYDKTISSITFKILDENNNVLRSIQNGALLPISGVTLPKTIRLRADFTTKNISADNPSLLRWGITFTKFTDTTPPYLYPSTTPPFNGTPFPTIRIKAKDNETGLQVNSAQYTLQYVINNISITKTYSARCNGTNGTTQVQNITANLSEISDYKNITLLKSITFSIKDLAGNTATKYFKGGTGDITPPSSYIITLSMKPRYNASAKFIWINASSFDNGTNASGIKEVKLYYRYSSTGNFTGDWVYFANYTKKSPHWKFNFTSYTSQHGGYFELCTIAIDNASNVEKFPAKGDVSFLYDWTKPYLPTFPGGILWFKEPSTFSVEFKDDFRLDTIQYHPNFDTSWTTIATDINASIYDKSWSLKEEYWNQMNEGEVYYLYFRINDTLGNTLLITSDSQAITVRKDTAVPNGTVKILPFNETSYNFTVIGDNVVDQGGSGIKEVSLYYRFSKDNSNWSSWTRYGDTLSSSPYDWEYRAQDGDGYYDFKINISDVAGNTRESEILHTSVFPVKRFLLPVTLILVMIGLFLILSLLSAMIFIKWKKRK